jgi:hypothetical protein
MNLSLLLEELLLELSPDEIQKKYYQNIPAGAFYAVALTDPQTAIDPESKRIIRIGKYTKILLNLFQKGKFKQEDSSKVKEYLTYAYKYHVPLDINKIYDISDIYNAVKRYMNIDSQDLGVIMKSLSSSEYKTLLNGKDWLILQPLTEKSACYLGVGTQWCTTFGPYSLTKEYQDRDNRYDTYSQKGPLYIMINKSNNKEKYQFHFETDQYMDSADHRIDTKEFFDQNTEIKNFFFPSFIREPSKEELELESKRLSMLSPDDALVLIKKMISGSDQQNPLVNAIINQNEEQLNILFQDDDIKQGVELAATDRNTGIDVIRFYLKSIRGDETERVKEALSSLKYDKQNSDQRVYEDQQNSIDEKEWKERLEPIFKEYYLGNQHDVQYQLGCPNYETFVASYYQGFFESDDIQEVYLQQLVNNSTDSFEENLQTYISHIMEYIDVDYDSEVSLNIVNFIKYLMFKNIEQINGNISDILEDYIDFSKIDTSDYYEIYYQYELIPPRYNQISSDIEKYFNDLMEDMETTTQCIEYREKFNMIFDRLFKNNPTYENDMVYIRINDMRVNCDDGTVDITYTNKKKKKTYRGAVKIENLPVYATNYELFECYVRFRENTKGVL